MRRHTITMSIVLGLALLSLTAQPVFAADRTATQNTPSALSAPAAAACHANSYKLGTDGYVTWSGKGTIIVELRYCSNYQSNFARVYWIPDNGTDIIPQAYEQINRNSGPDGGAISYTGISNIQANSFRDSQTVYSPNNSSYACGGVFPPVEFYACSSAA